jgi:hypothetical protein
MGPRDLWQVVRRMGPYRRSHHPLCGPFLPDVLVVGGQRYCIACYVGYPVLAFTVLSCLVLAPRLGAPWWAWCAAGLLVASPQAFSFAGRVPSARVQVGVKVALGAGFGAFMAGVLLLPAPLAVRLLLLAASLAGLNSLWLFRFHRLERTCQACPQNGLRPRCEGLRELDDRVGHLVRLPMAARPTAGGWVAVDETPGPGRGD